MLKALPHMKYGRKALWDCYMLHANEHGRARLSRATIAEETGLSHPIVGAARRWLIAHGALEPIRNSQTAMRVTGYLQPCGEAGCTECANGLTKTKMLVSGRESETLGASALARPGYVYLLQLGDIYKIGMSTKPRRRSRQIGAPLIHKIAVADMEEAEAALHRRFKNKRVRGEWFRLTPEDVTWIKSIDQM
jgi:hypothetical protein